MRNNAAQNILTHDLALINQLNGKIKMPAITPILAGADEVGRGALAGPVVAAVVCLPPFLLPSKKKNNSKANSKCGTTIIRKYNWVDKIFDSKKINKNMRKTLASCLQKHLSAYAIAYASVEEIDRMNILNASRLAVLRATRQLCLKGYIPSLLVLDALRLDSLSFHAAQLVGSNDHIAQLFLKKADEKSWVVAAASILAKVSRDAYMQNLCKTAPLSSNGNAARQYHFASNKGYGTAAHRMAIKKWGLGSFHRRSFTLHFLQK